MPKTKTKIKKIKGISGFRKKEKKLCAYCGKKFIGIKIAKCCSNACRCAMYRDKGKLRGKKTKHRS